MSQTEMRLTPLAQGIAKRMLEDSDREIHRLRDEIERLRQVNQELTFENEKLKAQLNPSEPLRKQITQCKETIAQLMKEIEKSKK